ncbi:MAG: nuclear transport factor 2 family protein [Balneolaceae bacterium]|nr:nuclear transport factor 2 family protein [Balneolaceae bacterium]MBO6546342.1 nuclear transport factor 2 family protein [Balneolaceae bacterium]
MSLFLILSCIKQPDQQLIAQRIQEFDTAYKTGDVEKLDEMISFDYLHTNPSGNIVTRENWLNWNISRARAIESGELVISAYETSELNIRIKNQYTVVASGVNYASGTDKGEPFETKVRFTHVWVLEDGLWKRAVFHDSYLD